MDEQLQLFFTTKGEFLFQIPKISFTYILKNHISENVDIRYFAGMLTYVILIIRYYFYNLHKISPYMLNNV